MPPESIKIDNARYVVTVDQERRILQDGSILIEDGRVSRVGKAASLAGARAHPAVDARNLVVAPGFVHGHMPNSHAPAGGGIFPGHPASPPAPALTLQIA